MSRPRKLLLAAGGAVAALLLALLVLPALFIDRVESRVRVGIEQATLVRVAWSDVHLGFFRDFPNPTLTLHGLDVVGTERFEGDTLASVGDLRLSMSGPSLINAIRGGGPLVIRSVQVDRPIVRLRVEDDGVSNWDVLPERDEAETGGGTGRNVAVELQRFEVSDAEIVLDDAPAGLFVSARGLEHWLRGDFSRASLAARTSTRADAVELRVAGAPYLTDISLEFDAELDVDLGEQRVRLSDNELRLNDLVVRLDGDLSRSGADIAMDLTFGAPSTSFEQILSLLPVLYAQDFASLETSGSFALDGTVQGAYGPTSFPSFAVDLSIADGRFRYPDVPIPVQGITAELAITNPGGDVDSTVVDLSRLRFEIGDQPMDAALTVRTPVSDPEADVRVEGTIDLNDAARALKLEGADELRGVIVADANARARRSDVDNQRWDRVAAGGTITAQDVTLRGASLRQPVDVRRARLHLTPRTAELQAFDARLGSSDVSATGRLDNLLGFALGGETLVGAATFGSERFHLDEWRSEDPIAIPVPKMLDLTLDGTISTLVFNGLEMTNARGRGLVRDQRLTLEGFMLEALGGRIGLDGYYETAGTEQPTFALDVVMDSVDVAGASAAFVTVRTLAPVARHARGTFSTNLNLSGALGQDLSPVLDVLEGEGSLSTSRVAIEGFPMLDRLAERLELERFSHPTVDAVRSNIHIENGRLRVDPFRANVDGIAMTVTGSNGIDQSVDYTLGIQVPRAGLADAALTRLAANAGPLGTRLATLDPVPVSVRVTGSVTQPMLDLGLGEAAGSLRTTATEGAAATAGQRIDEARARLDASEEEARQRAQARADSIVADAERRAETIRAEAREAAAEVRAQGDRAAEEVLARATNPLARAAAQPAAERIRREAEERAVAIEREADERATALVAEARARASAIVGG